MEVRMGRCCSVGGARGTFETSLAKEVAGVLGQTFGDGDWEQSDSSPFGEMDESAWIELRDRAVAELGAWETPNLQVLGTGSRVVFLPANVQGMTLKLSAGPLQCASLPGLRRELFELAERWEMPLEDDALGAILNDQDGDVANAPEITAFARLVVAANEAMRRDCPLWLVG